jgi:Spy/CpxP family protein refolding chaperone
MAGTQWKSREHDLEQDQTPRGKAPRRGPGLAFRGEDDSPGGLSSDAPGGLQSNCRTPERLRLLCRGKQRLPPRRNAIQTEGRQGAVMFRAIFLSILILFTASAVPAVPHEGVGGQQQVPWWRAEKTKAELGLTNEQAAKIEEIWQSVRGRLRSSMEEHQRLDEQFQKLMADPSVTEDQVVLQLAKVQAARNEADRQRVVMLFRMNQVLTAEQRTKLSAIRVRMEQERRRTPARPPSKKK